MRGLAFAVVGLLVAVPLVGSAEDPLPVPVGPPPVVIIGGGLQPGFGPPGFPGQPVNGDAKYKAPKGDAAVVELLDEDTEPLYPVLNNDGNFAGGSIHREDRDVFAGVESVRVLQQQKYRANIPGWKYKIVEKPKNAGEFRYIRFAWKKSGGTGIMIQLYDPVKTWVRYHSGRNLYGWQPSVQVAADIPGEWTLVTRDLWKDYGAITLVGIALSPLDGNGGHFDHMLLGRTIEDLDKASDAALGKIKQEKAPAGKERDALWGDLMGVDRAKAAAAQRALLASAKDHVAFVGEKLAKTGIDKELRQKIQKYLKDLDADDFDARDKATDELVKLGGAALEAVQALANNPPNDEVSYRAKLVLQSIKGGGGAVSSAGRLVRAVRVLERADTKEARELLKKVADGEFGFEVSADAKAALARLEKRK
jgi:hypothetical protein